MIKSIFKFIYFNKQYEKKIEIAYKILKQNNNIDQVYKIKEELKNLQFNNISIDRSFKDFDLNINLSLRQFIYSKFINTPLFTSKLIFALAFNESFYFPISKKYLNQINKYLKVNYFKSKILFILLLFFYFNYRWFQITTSFFIFLKKRKKILIQFI
jgi:hypothetical protein